MTVPDPAAPAGGTLPRPNMPDVTDPDNWPDLAAIPAAGLLQVGEWLAAEITVARIRGEPTTTLIHLQDVVQASYQSLWRLMMLSPLERWRMQHQPRQDPTGWWDCSADTCPPAGFVDAADEAMHHRRWGR